MKELNFVFSPLNDVQSVVQTRKAVLNDVSFIANLFQRGVSDGHYLRPNVSNEDMFSKIINDGYLEMDSGQKKIDLFSVAVNEIFCGFYAIKYESKMVSDPKAELWLFSLTAQYKGRGIGTALAKEISSELLKTKSMITARILPRSTKMKNTLIKIGFDNGEDFIAYDKYGRFGRYGKELLVQEMVLTSK